MARKSTPNLLDRGRRAAQAGSRDAARQAQASWNDAAKQATQAARQAKKGGRKAAKQARATWNDVASTMESAASRTRQAASETVDAAHGVGREAGRRARNTRDALAGRHPKPRRRWSFAAVLTGIGLGAVAGVLGRRLADRNADRLEHLETRFAEVDAQASDPTHPASGPPLSSRLNGAATADRLATVTGAPQPPPAAPVTPPVPPVTTTGTAAAPTATGTAPVPGDLPAVPATDADTPSQRRPARPANGPTTASGSAPAASGSAGKGVAKEKTDTTTPPTDLQP